MRKLIAAMNMTLDGFCDHTAMIADDEVHQHYNDLLSGAGILVYGRKTYQLMEVYWPTVVEKPTGNIPIDEFAVLIDDISKIVYSRTLKSVTWKNSELKHEIDITEISQLKQQPGKDILVGSPSLIVAFMNMGLVDEFQICVQPTIVGEGLSLLKNINDRVDLHLLNTKTLNGTGSVVLYYEPAGK